MHWHFNEWRVFDSIININFLIYKIFNCLNWLTLIQETHNETLQSRSVNILAKEKKVELKYDCSDQSDICTIQNAMTGIEISESISGMNETSILSYYIFILIWKIVSAGWRNYGNRLRNKIVALNTIALQNIY